MKTLTIFSSGENVTTLILRECEDEDSHFRNGNWESIGTSETSESDWRGQNTLHWGFLYINGKLLKCRCLKWACMSHLHICSISYGKKKGWEWKWQFDSDHKKLGIDRTLVCVGGVQHTIGKLLMRATTLLQTSSWLEVWKNTYSPMKLRESTLW
jgi:hypothetical protein